MKILIVGAGSVGKRHAENLMRHEEKIGMVDPRQDRLINSNGYLDLDDALNECWDAAIIASPPSVHVEQCEKLLDLSIPVLMEKPICPTLDDAMSIRNKVKNGILLMGYTYRWWEPFLFFKDNLSSIGNIYRTDCCMGAHLEDWHPWERYQDFFMAHKELGGGALLDESHVIDLMLWLFGPPKDVFGSVSKISDLEINTDDNVESIWFYDEMIVNIHLDLYRRPHERSITAFGSDGTLKWSFDEVLLNGNSIKPFTCQRNDMFLNEIEHFLDVVNEISEPKCTYEDGLDVLRMVESIRESSNKRKVVQCEM